VVAFRNLRRGGRASQRTLNFEAFERRARVLLILCRQLQPRSVGFFRVELLPRVVELLLSHARLRIRVEEFGRWA